MEHIKKSLGTRFIYKITTSMDVHTSVVNRNTFQVFPPYKWELKFNTELLNFNKNETNHGINSQKFFFCLLV